MMKQREMKLEKIERPSENWLDQIKCKIVEEAKNISITASGHNPWFQIPSTSAMGLEIEGNLE